MVILCLSKAWGGLEQVAANDAVALTQAGIACRVLCIKDSPIHRYLLSRGPVSCETLSQPPRNFLDFKMRALIKKWAAQGVTLLHTHQTSYLGSLTPWLWFQPKLALVVSRHIMNNHNKRGIFHSIIYRRVDALIVMSEALRKNVLATHRIRERHVRVVRLGLDFTQFNATRVHRKSRRSEWGAEEDTVVIGLVGRIDPAKGQGTFLRSAARLVHDFPQKKLLFVLVGEETVGAESDYLASLRELLRVYDLERKVIFTGFIQDIPEVMAALDILVMPSRQEAFGMVAIEAMAMETPVIISSAGSAREIVGNEEYGLLVRPEDAFDLYQKLRRMIEGPQERQEMGKQARLFVTRAYDVQARLQKTLEIYEKLLRLRR